MVYEAQPEVSMRIDWCVYINGRLFSVHRDQDSAWIAAYTEKVRAPKARVTVRAVS